VQEEALRLTWTRVREVKVRREIGRRHFDEARYRVTGREQLSRMSRQAVERARQAHATRRAHATR
jgi:hypothetical protein